MTTGHIFFIPLMIAVGFVAGLLLGRRSHEMEAGEEARLQARRESRRARLREQSDVGGDSSAPESSP